MSDPNIPESPSTVEFTESFEDLLSEHERSRTRRPDAGGKGLEGTVIAVTGDSVWLDIGYKVEGILPLAAFEGSADTVKPGDKLMVSIKGRDPDGYYELSRGRVEHPKDWQSLEKAFSEGATVAGVVTGVVKGGLSVDVGARAFLPASRSGARDAAEMEKLVGEEIRCRIIKLDVADEDVVVDRRIVAQEEERALKTRRFSEIREDETVPGVVSSLTDFGAFVDLGGVEGLLHISDISWNRIGKASDVLAVGDQIEVKVLRVDPDRRRISLGLKQLQPQPWDSAADRYAVGQRVSGTVTRVADFGVFVELEPGIEGLIHISEMSWSKRVKHPSEVVKPGEVVEAVILALNPVARRISLGLKQALGDPWAGVEQKFPVGSVIEGPVTSLTKFGAFVQISEGVEGMIHISEISAEKRINHPQDELKLGQAVNAQVLAIDTERRQIRLSIKQLVPSSLDEYIAEHKEGDVVTGRMTDVSGGRARVELGEGIEAFCPLDAEDAEGSRTLEETKLDLSSLTSRLQARWKGGGPDSSQSKSASRGQIRSFRITRLDPAAKKIELKVE